MGATINDDQRQQNHRFRKDSSLSHWSVCVWGGGGKYVLLVFNYRQDFVAAKTRNVLSSHGGFLNWNQYFMMI